MIRRVLSFGIFLFAVFGFSFSVAESASAYSGPMSQFAATCDYGKDSAVRYFFGFPSWDACLPKQSGEPIITSMTDIWLVAFPIVETMIRAAGYLAVGLILWGSLTYIRNDGDQSRIVGARKTIFNALIGLVVAILSVAIVRFVAGGFNG